MSRSMPNLYFFPCYRGVKSVKATATAACFLLPTSIVLLTLYESGRIDAWSGLRREMPMWNEPWSHLAFGRRYVSVWCVYVPVWNTISWLTIRDEMSFVECPQHSVANPFSFIVFCYFIDARRMQRIARSQLFEMAHVWILFLRSTLFSSMAQCTSKYFPSRCLGLARTFHLSYLRSLSRCHSIVRS